MLVSFILKYPINFSQLLTIILKFSLPLMIFLILIKQYDHSIIIND